MPPETLQTLLALPAVLESSVKKKKRKRVWVMFKLVERERN